MIYCVIFKSKPLGTVSDEEKAYVKEVKVSDAIRILKENTANFKSPYAE